MTDAVPAPELPGLRRDDERSARQAGGIHGAYQACTEAMKQAGAYATKSGLSPATNDTTLRTRGGETTVLDGPFAETKEQLAGFSAEPAVLRSG